MCSTKGEKFAGVFMFSKESSTGFRSLCAATRNNGKPHLVQGRAPILPAAGSRKIERPESFVDTQDLRYVEG